MQCSNPCAAVDLLQSAACRAHVELGGPFIHSEIAAEAGDERLLNRQLAAKGVDGGDVKLGREVRDLPAECCASA